MIFKLKIDKNELTLIKKRSKLIDSNRKEIEITLKLQSSTGLPTWNRICIVIVVQIRWNPSSNGKQFGLPNPLSLGPTDILYVLWYSKKAKLI